MPDQSAEDAFSFLSQQMVELGYLGQAPAVEDGELQFLPLSRVSVSFQILCGLLLLPFLIVCNTDCCSYNCHGPSMSPITWHSEYPVKGSCLDDRKTCFSNFLKVSIKLCKILSAHFPAVSPPLSRAHISSNLSLCPPSIFGFGSLGPWLPSGKSDGWDIGMGIQAAALEEK